MSICSTWIPAFLALVCLLLTPLQARTWTDVEGVGIEAELVRVEGRTAILRKDGRVFRVPLARLSAEDQEFLETRQVDLGGSRKKGYCLAPRKTPDWPKRLEALNACWFYVWGAGKPAGAPKGVEFVPMVFGKAQWLDQTIKSVDQHKEREAYKFVLGYNEPDRAKQANMSVEAALAAWPKLMKLDLPLVSPAAAKADGEWMERFMAGVEKNGYRVDYIAVHWYGNADADQFLRMLDRVREKYGRPIWITEFAVADWQAKTLDQNRLSVAEIMEFMRKVLPELERREEIHRYSWFCAAPGNAVLGHSALFAADGSLTELGEVYAAQR